MGWRETRGGGACARAFAAMRASEVTAAEKAAGQRPDVRDLIM